MDPFEAGRLVLRGMRNDDLYILTHAEYEQIMRDRHDAIVSSLPTGLWSTEARRAAANALSRDSIYASERNRKRAQAGLFPPAPPQAVDTPGGAT
jgi:hypothetical protein